MEYTVSVLTIRVASHSCLSLPKISQQHDVKTVKPFTPRCQLVLSQNPSRKIFSFPGRTIDMALCRTLFSLFSTSGKSRRNPLPHFNYCRRRVPIQSLFYLSQFFITILVFRYTLNRKKCHQGVSALYKPPFVRIAKVEQVDMNWMCY